MDLLQSIGKTPLIRLAKLPATLAAPSKTVPPSV